MKRRVNALVLLIVLSVLGPALATGEAGGHRSPSNDVVLYELNEQAQFTVDKGRLHRVAMSGLEGKARLGTPLCTEDLMDHAEKVFKARQRLLKAARSDLRAAEALAADAEQDDDVVGFHAQQAVEKSGGDRGLWVGNPVHARRQLPPRCLGWPSRAGTRCARKPFALPREPRQYGAK